MRRSLFATVILLLGCSDWRADAAPYAIDDTDVVAPHSLALAVFSEGRTNAGPESGSTFGLELEYGVAPRLEVSAALPVGSSAAVRGRTRLDVSHIEFGFKYGIVDSARSLLPTIVFAPSTDLSFGSGRNEDHATHVFLPLWLEKPWGGWTLRGGAGYRINPGRDECNAVFYGVGFSKGLGDRLSVGGEIYRETSPVRNEPAAAAFNVGGTYDVSDNVQIEVSAGSALTTRSGNSGLNYYFGVQWEV